MRIILFLLKCLLGLFASIGFLLVAAVAVLAVLASQYEPFEWEPRQIAVPDGTVLTLDLAAGVTEVRPDNPLARASQGRVLVLRETLETLEAAGRDPRVQGLVVRLGRGALGFADVQELRDAIRRFRDNGKFALGFAESFGEGGNGTLHYYLASALNTIWLQPSGDVDVTGVSLESPYLRDSFDLLGLEPQFDQREEYKGAMNQFTDRELPAPQRENLQRLVDSWIGQIARGVAEGRNLDSAEVRRLIDRAPFLPSEAVANGLIDRLGYWDEASDAALEAAQDATGSEAEFLGLKDYAAAREAPEPDGPVIALIHGLGPVVLDGSENDPVFGQVVMGSDTVSEALADAVADEEVAAIVFRIDSPGGSYVASDAIWREVQNARDREVPVIVSMGNVAASGGYFVAAPAHKIVAQPGTVTGSIGVVSGKLVLTGLWDKLGVNWDGVKAGDNADIWSANRRFSQDGWDHLQRFLDSAYEDFTNKVAEGRGLDRAQTLQAAKGRVWTGEDARELGLVDALGGYREAIDLARTAAGVAENQTVEIRPFPMVRDPWEALFEDAFGAAADSPAVRALARGLAGLAQALAPIARGLDLLTADPRAQRLRAPELRVGP